MKLNNRLKIAIQKSGRLTEHCGKLLTSMGLHWSFQDRSLMSAVGNRPIDIIHVRNTDIPNLVMDGAVDLGITGENVLLEAILARQNKNIQANYTSLCRLSFGQCRLSLAIPEKYSFSGLSSLQNCKIATSYPLILARFLKQHRINATIVTLSGSVEVAPLVGMADAICDIVSTGNTLRANGLVEVVGVLQSNATLIQHNKELDKPENKLVSTFLANLREKGQVAFPAFSVKPSSASQLNMN